MKRFVKLELIPGLASLFFIFISCEKTETIDQPGDPVNITTEVYQKEVIDSANRFAFNPNSIFFY